MIGLDQHGHAHSLHDDVLAKRAFIQ